MPQQLPSYIASELVERFRFALDSLDLRFTGRQDFGDDVVDAETRRWLDGDDQPLAWSSVDRITPDEWFFITTLHGNMPLDAQRRQIRSFFPRLFIADAKRDVRDFPSLNSPYQGLRHPWMAKRLRKMAEILRECGMSMADYVAYLRDLSSWPQIVCPSSPPLSRGSRPPLRASALDARFRGHDDLVVHPISGQMPSQRSWRNPSRN